ncbi:MAG TPA: DUF1491 family protein, partial [Alphaproteobacteria bacterium]|nr:DUF1491 family protein [Alphaproteobacteria bacterium]
QIVPATERHGERRGAIRAVSFLWVTRWKPAMRPAKNSEAMSNERIATELWVNAQLRRFSAVGTGAYLVRKGDTERGTVLVRLVERVGTRILTQVRDLNGRLTWMEVKDGAVLSNEDADAYVERAVNRDSDLWVIEVETRNGENPFDKEIVGL